MRAETKNIESTSSRLNKRIQAESQSQSQSQTQEGSRYQKKPPCDDLPFGAIIVLGRMTIVMAWTGRGVRQRFRRAIEVLMNGG